MIRAQLELYRVFHEVARCGSVSRAAEGLFVTQPAVSQSIRNLEDDLDIQLFHRLPRGMGLTKAGERLFGFVEQAIGLIDAAEREVERVAELDTGELYLAAGDSICRHHLLPHLEKFRASYPGVHVRITNRTSDATIELVRSGRVDLGLVNSPCETSGVEIEPICEIHDCFVAGDLYDTSGDPLTWQELCELPLLMLETGTATRRYLEAEFLKGGVDIRPEIELGSIDLLAQFAISKFGIAAVVREYVAELIEERALTEVSIDPPLRPRSIGVVYRTGIPLSPAAERLLEHIREGVA